MTATRATLACASAALALLASAAPARAQHRDAAPLVLRLPPSTRALAMGGAQPMADDPEAFLASAPLLNWSRGVSAQVQRWGAASTEGILTSAAPALAGAVGLAVQYLDYGAAAARLPDATRDGAGALPRRGGVSASSLSAAVGYARPLMGLRVGVLAKYAEERLGDARDGTLAVDVGAGAMMVQRLAVSLGVQNLGPGLRLAGTRAPLPTRVTLGASGAGLPLTGWFDLGASAAVSVLRGGRVVGGAGVEGSIVPIEGYAVSLRAGARRPVDPREQAVTAGIGLTRDRVSLDYAFEPFVGRDAHRVGIRVR